ncbi:histidine kinase [Cytophagales bacterium LB-30]|uniref:Histidine kinase n=1 Tax=Shiella aurantiaca TaxID=3058365 RepID=A0ABT8F8V7_9BACT|nr:histidine kinase [Shiella aurantiaca]MDN4166862.1 histidine kinase [Shiella aurantiaca]
MATWLKVVLYVSWWLFWSALQAYALHTLSFSWESALSDALLSHILLGLAGVAVANIFRFYQPEGKNIIYLMSLAIGLTFLVQWVFQWLFPYLLLGNDIAYLAFAQKAAPFRIAYQGLMIAFMVLFGWLWFYVKDQHRKNQHISEVDNMRKEAELFNLRQQLQPHFLFNSLNSISSLVKIKPEEARGMIQQLSDFLRGTLRKDPQQMVSLAEEIRQMELYLSIEKVRFGSRLQSRLEISEEALQAHIPPLLLQPLLENAIKYGLYDTLEPIEIILKAERKNDMLQIRLENPFDSSTRQAAGTGFGQRSVARRLYLLFGRNDLLQIKQTDTHYAVLVKIPQETNEQK